MKLLDVDDFNAMDRKGPPHTLTLNEDGSQDPGPFLFFVNDQMAWMGRHNEFFDRVSWVPLSLATASVRGTHWYRAADLWMQGEDITRNAMLRRYKSITRKLEATGPLMWTRWEILYHWDEGSDLLWDGLEIHPFITRREQYGQREVVITGSRHDQRTREWGVEL